MTKSLKKTKPSQDFQLRREKQKSLNSLKEITAEMKSQSNLAKQEKRLKMEAKIQKKEQSKVMLNSKKLKRMSKKQFLAQVKKSTSIIPS
jgi:hypothetical protein